MKDYPFIRKIGSIALRTLQWFNPFISKQTPVIFVAGLCAIIMTIIFTATWIFDTFNRSYFELMLNLWGFLFIMNLCEATGDIYRKVKEEKKRRL